MLAPRGPGVRAVALPFLADLQADTRQQAELAVLDGCDVVRVERLPGGGGGARRPAHTTAAGLVLLAFAPAGVQRHHLAPLTVADAHALRRVLAAVRHQGYALGGPAPAAPSAVAAPVRGGDGDVVAAVGVVGTAGRAAATGLVPAVTATARQISRALAA
jgi:DNA-binding IclR family transcriptional regulator